jgi:hypothetical protein
MSNFWRRHRALRILSYVVPALLFLLCALPYLIPLGETEAEISLDKLVSEHGRFLDIDGMGIYVEEQSPELFNTMALTFLQSLGE